MKKVFVYALIGLSLILGTSCSKEHNTPTNTELDDQSYVTLHLSINGEEDKEETMRTAAMYEEAGKIKFSFSHAEGFTKETRKVLTTVFNGDKVIYQGTLDWKIANNGTRLTYDGPIKIKPDDLKNPDLKLTASVTYDQDLYPFQNGSTNMIGHPRPHASVVAIERNGGREARTEINVPFIMNAKVKQDGSKLVIADHSTAKFKPIGTLVRLSIQNNMAVPTFATAIGIKLKDGQYYESQIGTYGLYKNSEAQDGIISVAPGGAKNKVTLLVILPVIQEEIEELYTYGPAYGKAVPSKVGGKAGELIDYTVTVNPGEVLKPFGIYTSSERIVQFWVDTEKNVAFFDSSDKFDALRAMRRINPSAYIPSRYQLNYFAIHPEHYGQEPTEEQMRDGITYLTPKYTHVADREQYAVRQRLDDQGATSYLNFVQSGAIATLHSKHRIKNFVTYSQLGTKSDEVKYQEGTTDAFGEFYPSGPLYTSSPDIKKLQLLRRYETYMERGKRDYISGPVVNKRALIYSFLPYDANEQALDEEYWQNKNQVVYKFPVFWLASSHRHSYLNAGSVNPLHNLYTTGYDLGLFLQIPDGSGIDFALDWSRNYFSRFHSDEGYPAALFFFTEIQ